MTSLLMVRRGNSREGVEVNRRARLARDWSARSPSSTASPPRDAPCGPTSTPGSPTRASPPPTASSGTSGTSPASTRRCGPRPGRSFPGTVYERFHSRLVWWGRRTLGCHDVSPPWLSVYVEGCGQELHGDLPHGPWAFVYSLTRWKGRRFRGGETEILRDEVLDWWGGVPVHPQGRAAGARCGIVEPRFDRLVAFDPRLPHAVRTVRGTLDPREGRVVVHGWFVSPRPFVEGALDPAELVPRIDSLSEAILPLARAPARGRTPLPGIPRHARRAASADARVLSDTTRVPSGAERERRRLVAAARAARRRLALPPAPGPLPRHPPARLRALERATWKSPTSRTSPASSRSRSRRRSSSRASPPCSTSSSTGSPASSTGPGSSRSGSSRAATTPPSSRSSGTAGSWSAGPSPWAPVRRSSSRWSSASPSWDSSSA